MVHIHEARKRLDLPLENTDPAFAISFLDNVDAELSPVAAILGGMIAQGVINYLGKREQPLQNFLVFDGDKMSAPIYSLHPQPEE
jgi:ubiquitin-like 1-activating enzyme E1 A